MTENQEDHSLSEPSSSQEMRALLLEKAKDSGISPGVYLMKAKDQTILYVGKAKNLKNRLTTYFQPAKHPTPRIELLVAQVDEFETILTETEAEALILECTLIKKHKPKFNIRLKDDKAYPYLKISTQNPYPRIEWTRRVQRDSARYFGPFPSAWSARQVLRLLNEAFLLRDCSDNTFKHRSRPCILYQMHQCTAPCVAKISADEYREQIQNVVNVLEGKSKKFLNELKSQMEKAALDEEFEQAAQIRDQLQSLELITATQVADEANSARNRDVVSIARGEGAESHGVILQIRAGQMVSVKHLHLQNSDSTQTDSEILADFVSQFYISHQGSGKKSKDELPEDLHPTEILVGELPEDHALLETTLKMSFKQPETQTEKQLLTVAQSNARHGLEQSLKKSAGHGVRALEEVAEKLHLERLPRRIECYDNSNIQGEDAVGSRVVFIDGAPNKDLYRRYKIKTVEGANDFATMREVLSRRFSHVDEPLPDLVVVDGGKGQLSQAVAILEELGVVEVGVVGLAKARTESDFKSKEVKSSHERIFVPGRKNPIPLLPHTEAYKLLVHVRDEAHRFAVSYHRVLRQKRTLKN